MTSLDSHLRNDLLLEARGMASRHEIALALVAVRKAARLTQPQLAQRAAWQPQFVCRLESPRGRLPNLLRLTRYAHACRVDLGLVFSTPHLDGLSVVRAITLQASHSTPLFEALNGRFIALAPRTPV